MSSIQIIVGSMLGGTEYVAEACQEILEELNHETQIHFSPELDQIPYSEQIWLLCTSTHGAGDYPDNIKDFVDNLLNTNKNLSSLKFATLGVGDSSYDTFCFAAKNIEKLLITKNCSKLVNLKTIDMQLDIDPEEEAKEWILSIKDHL